MTRLVAALLLATACAAPVEEPTLHVLPFEAEIQLSPEFSLDEQAAIENAVADLYQATGGSVRLQLVTTPATWRISPDATIDSMGSCNRHDAAIRLNLPRITPPSIPQTLPYLDYLTDVTTHELLHALGLPHSPQFPPHVTDCITQASLTALSQLQPLASHQPTCP